MLSLPLGPIWSSISDTNKKSSPTLATAFDSSFVGKSHEQISNRIIRWKDEKTTSWMSNFHHTITDWFSKRILGNI